MSERGRKRRVRVITDPGQHRRHQLKKLFRKLLKFIAWALVVVIAIILVWAVLDMLFRPRPLPQE